MTTMNFSLPDEMKAFVEAQVTQEGYATTSEYLRLSGTRRGGGRGESSSPSSWRGYRARRRNGTCSSGRSNTSCGARSKKTERPEPAIDFTNVLG